MGSACCKQDFRFKKFVVAVYPKEKEADADRNALYKLINYVGHNPERIPRVCRKVRKQIDVDLASNLFRRVGVGVTIFRELMCSAKDTSATGRQQSNPKRKQTDMPQSSGGPLSYYIPPVLDLVTMLLKRDEPEYRVAAADLLTALASQMLSPAYVSDVSAKQLFFDSLMFESIGSASAALPADATPRASVPVTNVFDHLRKMLDADVGSLSIEALHCRYAAVVAVGELAAVLGTLLLTPAPTQHLSVDTPLMSPTVGPLAPTVSIASTTAASAASSTIAENFLSRVLRIFHIAVQDAERREKESQQNTLGLACSIDALPAAAQKSMEPCSGSTLQRLLQLTQTFEVQRTVALPTDPIKKDVLYQTACLRAIANLADCSGSSSDRANQMLDTVTTYLVHFGGLGTPTFSLAVCYTIASTLQRKQQNGLLVSTALMHVVHQGSQVGDICTVLRAVSCVVNVVPLVGSRPTQVFNVVFKLLQQQQQQQQHHYNSTGLANNSLTGSLPGGHSSSTQAVIAAAVQTLVEVIRGAHRHNNKPPVVRMIGAVARVISTLLKSNSFQHEKAGSGRLSDKGSVDGRVNRKVISGSNYSETSIVTRPEDGSPALGPLHDTAAGPGPYVPDVRILPLLELLLQVADCVGGTNVSPSDKHDLSLLATLLPILCGHRGSSSARAAALRTASAYISGQKYPTEELNKSCSSPFSTFLYTQDVFFQEQKEEESSLKFNDTSDVASSGPRTTRVSGSTGTGSLLPSDEKMLMTWGADLLQQNRITASILCGISDVFSAIIHTVKWNAFPWLFGFIFDTHALLLEKVDAENDPTTDSSPRKSSLTMHTVAWNVVLCACVHSAAAALNLHSLKQYAQTAYRDNVAAVSGYFKRNLVDNPTVISQSGLRCVNDNGDGELDHSGAGPQVVLDSIPVVLEDPLRILSVETIVWYLLRSGGPQQVQLKNVLLGSPKDEVPMSPATFGFSPADPDSVRLQEEEIKRAILDLGQMYKKSGALTMGSPSKANSEPRGMPAISYANDSLIPDIVRREVPSMYRSQPDSLLTPTGGVPYIPSFAANALDLSANAVGGPQQVSHEPATVVLRTGSFEDLSPALGNWQNAYRAINTFSTLSSLPRDNGVELGSRARTYFPSIISLSALEKAVHAEEDGEEDDPNAATSPYLTICSPLATRSQPPPFPVEDAESISCANLSLVLPPAKAARIMAGLKDEKQQPGTAFSDTANIRSASENRSPLIPKGKKAVIWPKYVDCNQKECNGVSMFPSALFELVPQ